MNTLELKNALLAFLRNSMNKDAETLTANDSLKEAGIDSFKTIELILFLETRYGISFPDEAYTSDNLKSINSIVNCATDYHKRNASKGIENP